MCVMTPGLIMLQCTVLGNILYGNGVVNYKGMWGCYVEYYSVGGWGSDMPGSGLGDGRW